MSVTLFVGHSHVEVLRRAWLQYRAGVATDSNNFKFLCIREQKFRKNDKNGSHLAPLCPASTNCAVLQDEFNYSASDVDAVVFIVTANEHNSIGMFCVSEDSDAQVADIIRSTVYERYSQWLEFFKPLCVGLKTYVLMAPPPVESDRLIYTYANKRAKGLPLRFPSARQSFWKCQCEQVSVVAKKYGAEIITLPATVFSETGFLREDLVGTGATHGNDQYGILVLQHISGIISAGTPIGCMDTKSSAHNQINIPSIAHPYSSLPSYAYWHQSVSQVAGDALDPVVSPRFIIKRNDKVATAGSCFAQHISKRLKTSGFNYFVAEKHDAESSPELYDFSARYGNVYTARQLVQLFDRAFGYFNPIDKVWPHTKSGAYCDPFRPRIEPNGFVDEQAVLQDRKKHLASVRRMFKQLDVFVFTLGLTECWLSRLDGAAFPVAPGVVGGAFDSTRYEFVNFGVQDVVTDLHLFIRKLKLVNPKARIILTVSPVPLVATQEQQHVLVATTYSKSVLRVAADEIARAHDHVQYFPSYEIITGPHASGRYFAADLRSVTEEGVDHVMRVFMNRMTEQSVLESGRAVSQDAEKRFAEMEELAEAACDEELYAHR